MILRTDDLFILSNSIFSIFIWFAVWKFFCSVRDLINQRALIFAVILGGIFSTFMVFGANIFSNDSTGINHFKTWATILAGMPFFAAVIIWIFNFIDNFKLSSNVATSISSKKYFFMSWSLIFVAWILELLAQFPGIYAYDSSTQVALYRDNMINFVHPPIHTAILGFCTVTLGNFFGSYEAGFLVYTLFQMLILSSVFAAILACMFVKKIPKYFRIGWLIFFMFFPLNPIMAMSATKDILFASFFIAILLIFFMSLKNPPKYFYLSAILISFLCIIFRSQGIYVFAFGMIFGILIMKGQRIKIFKLFSAVILLYIIYTGVIIGVLGGVNDKIFALREMLGVPVVQISRVGVYRKDELSANEIEQIKKYIPDFEIYNVPGARGSSDPPRARFHSALVYENPNEFWNLWKKFALKYPIDYFDAFCRMTVGQWYPDLFFTKYYDGQPYFQYESFRKDAENHIIIIRSGDLLHKTSESYPNEIIPENRTFYGFQWLHDFCHKLAYNSSYERIPIISMIFSTGFTFWLVLIFIFYFIYKKNYYALFPSAFIIGLWLTMILGPLALYRYTFPLAVSIPILFTFSVTINDKQEEQKF